MDYDEFVRIFRERAEKRMAEFDRSVDKATERRTDAARQAQGMPQERAPIRRVYRARKVRGILKEQ